MEVLEQHHKNFIGRLPEAGALGGYPFPTSKDEAYKYTRIAALKNADLSWPTEELTEDHQVEIKAFIEAKELKNVLVFFNGAYYDGLSEVKTLNTKAFDWQNKIFIDQVFAQLAFQKNDQIYNLVFDQQESINIIHYISQNQSIYANSIHMEIPNDVTLNISEYYIGSGAKTSFININRNFILEDNAYLKVHADQLLDHGAFYMSHNYASVGSAAKFDFNAVNSGYQILRNNILVDILGSEGDANVHQAFLGQDKNLLDNHILINHFAPNTTSNQLVKGVMDGKSRGIFNGKVYVAKDAQKVNAYQTNNNIILDPEAIVDAKPELEIYADDVRCSHGSTTGQINEDALFYLRSRGIGLKGAHQLLLQSFIEEVINEFSDETFITHTKEQLNQILSYDFE